MSESNKGISKSEMEEAIYNLYLDIKSKLSSGEILIIDEEREKLKEINVFNIISYIKESINILIKIKVEEGIKKYQKEQKKKLDSLTNSNLDSKISNVLNQQEEYEKLICKLESDIRNHIKVEFQMKLQNEYLEEKLQDSDELENELERLQDQIEKYEKKIHYDEYASITDKKDNEILILRAENTNIKNVLKINEDKIISLTESESKLHEEKNKLENELSFTNQLIEKLNKKIQNYENLFIQSPNSNRIHLSGNMSINISKEKDDKIDATRMMKTLSKENMKRCSSVVDKFNKICLNKSDCHKEKEMEFNYNEAMEPNTYRKYSGNTSATFKNMQNVDNSINSGKGLLGLTKVKFPVNKKNSAILNSFNISSNNSHFASINSNLKVKGISSPEFKQKLISNSILNNVRSTNNILQGNSSSNNKNSNINSNLKISSLKQYVYSKVPKNKISNISPTINMKSTSISNH